MFCSLVFLKYRRYVAQIRFEPKVRDFMLNDNKQKNRHEPWTIEGIDTGVKGTGHWNGVYRWERDK